MKQLIQRYPIASERASFFFLLLMMLVTGFVGGQFAGNATERINHELMTLFGRYYLFFLIVLVPWIETLLFQALPAVIGQICVRQAMWRWLIIVVPFGLAQIVTSYLSKVPVALGEGQAPAWPIRSTTRSKFFDVQPYRQIA